MSMQPLQPFVFTTPKPWSGRKFVRSTASGNTTNVLSLKGFSGGSGSNGNACHEPSAPQAASNSSSSMPMPKLPELASFISSCSRCSSARAFGSTCTSAWRDAFKLPGKDFSLRMPPMASEMVSRRSPTEKSSEPRRLRRDMAHAAVMSGGRAPPDGGSAGPRTGLLFTSFGTTKVPERNASLQSPLTCFDNSPNTKSEDERCWSYGAWKTGLGSGVAGVSTGSSPIRDDPLEDHGHRMTHLPPARRVSERSCPVKCGPHLAI
mmetsp:Transcript_90151/g.252011  ORF Transcript_90151/g.252011 Transcript_90151/m.252011 type:complete len:263 (+) Transcript_90151:729-1517(+)